MNIYLEACWSLDLRMDMGEGASSIGLELGGAETPGESAMLLCLLLLTAVTVNSFNAVCSVNGHWLHTVRAIGRVERTANLGGDRGAKEGYWLRCD